MGRKVTQGSRGKSGETGRTTVALRKGATPTPTPPHKGEGPKHSNPFMPGLRVRSDGWTAARTRVFLATLGRTGCITDAARIAGVSTTSVNRSRALFPPFDTACDAAIARALRGLEAVAYERAVEGREMVVIRDGREVERRIMPSDSMLGLLIKRGDLKNGRDVQLTPEEAEAWELPEAVRHRFLTREEFFSGITFDNRRGAGKCQRPTPEETDTEILRRIAIIERARARADGAARSCHACGRVLDEAASDHVAAKAAQEIAPRDPVWDRPPVPLPVVPPSRR